MTRRTRVVPAGLLFTMLAGLVGLPAAPAAAVAAADSTVFLNELHYDNADTDAGEAVEIAGPAGTDFPGGAWCSTTATTASPTARAR